MILFGIIYFTTGIANHYYFRTNTFDYGLYNYAFRDYAHFHVSKCPIYTNENMSLLQDHFSLVLIYLAPLYWLLNWLTGTYTLILIQSVMLLLGGWGVYKLIKLKTADGWMANLALLYYFLLQGHYSAFAGDCNITVIGSCFVPLFLYYFESRKYKTATLFFVLALVAKENMALWLIFLFPLLIFWHRKERRIILYCFGYITLSLFYFIVQFKFFIPMLHVNERAYNLFNYSALGSDPMQALQFVFTHPLETFKLLYSEGSNPLYKDVKVEFYMVYLLSGGFILFYRPQYLIWFIPIVAQKMLNDEPVRWSIQWHYSIEVATILPIAVFMILSNEKKAGWRYTHAAIVCILAFLVTNYKMDVKNRKMPWTKTTKENILDSAFFHSDLNIEKINDDLKKIPSDARVSSSLTFLPHLADRKYIYAFPDVSNAEYIVALTYKDHPYRSKSEYMDVLLQYCFDPNWTIIANDYPVFILKKESNITSNHRVLDSVFCDAETVTDDKHLQATAGKLFYSPADIQSNEKSHSGKYSVKLTKENAYGLTYLPDDFTTGDIINITIWKYSTDTLKNGTLVISCGKNFYLAESNPLFTDKNGWKEINASFIVPPDHSNLKIYVWDNYGTPVWVDDMKILHIHNAALRSSR